MARFEHYFPGLSKNTFLLALASLFADISTEMLYPVLPVFLTQTLHTSGSVVGLIEGIAQATQNIVQGFSGWVSDKLQQRKPVAMAGYALAAFAKPLMGVSPDWSGVLVGRFLDRLGTGTRSAPRDALIASSADEQSRGKAFGLEGIGDNAGACLGPLLALVLLGAFTFNIRTIFYVAIVPGLLAFFMVTLVQERQSSVSAKSMIDTRLTQFPRGYWNYLLLTALFGIGNFSTSFLILQTQDVGASLQTTILIYAGFNFVAAVISYPSGALSDQWGRRNILLTSFIILLVTYLGFALTRNIAIVAGLFALYGAYQGIYRSVGKALAADLVPEHLRASGLGWFNATVGLLGFVASLIAGLLWDRVGHAAVFLFGAAFSVVSSAVLPLLLPSDAPKLTSN